MKIEPVTLAGKIVRLEPLSYAHTLDLAEAGNDETIWRYMLYGNVDSAERMRAWIEDMLTRQAAGADLPFAVIHMESGRAIGATRFMEISAVHRRVEIGGTWYAPRFQRTAVNSECKYLLLQHAFQTWDCIRIQLKTDRRNERSRRAIERLGAVQEGIFRNHMITPEGVIRDSVYYSIIREEWPAVKARLEGFLARG